MRKAPSAHVGLSVFFVESGRCVNHGELSSSYGLRREQVCTEKCRAEECGSSRGQLKLCQNLAHV